MWYVRSVLFCTVLVLFPSATLAAMISPTSQLRTISATAHGDWYQQGPPPPDDECQDSESASDSALEFGAFTSNVSASERCWGSAGMASQTSSILDAQITGVGAAEASGEGLKLIGFGTASADSSIDVSFLVSEDVTYYFHGQVSAEWRGDADFKAFIRLKGVDDSDIHFLETTTGAMSIMTSGTLPAGEYVLEAGARALPLTYGGFGAASFTVEFTVVPEPSTSILATLSLLSLVLWRRKSYHTGSAFGQIVLDDGEFHVLSQDVSQQVQVLNGSELDLRARIESFDPALGLDQASANVNGGTIAFPPEPDAMGPIVTLERADFVLNTGDIRRSGILANNSNIEINRGQITPEENQGIFAKGWSSVEMNGGAIKPGFEVGGGIWLQDSAKTSILEIICPN